MRGMNGDKGEVVDLRGASAVLTTPGLMERKIKPSSLSATARCDEPNYLLYACHCLPAYLETANTRAALETQYEGCPT